MKNAIYFEVSVYGSGTAEYKVSFLEDVALCRFAVCYRRLGGLYLSHLQGLRIPGKILDFLTPETGQITSPEMSATNCQPTRRKHPRRATTSATARLKPEISHQHLPSAISLLVDEYTKNIRIIKL